jgi:hypothetical protein
VGAVTGDGRIGRRAAVFVVVHAVRRPPPTRTTEQAVHAHSQELQFMGKDDPINVLLEYPSEFTATFEATLATGIKGEAVELCGTEGRLYIDRQKYEYTPAGKGAKTTTVKVFRRPGRGSRDEFPGVRALAQAAPRRCLHWASLGAGIAPGEHQLYAETADRLRPHAGRDSAVLSAPCRTGREACPTDQAPSLTERPVSSS